MYKIFFIYLVLVSFLNAYSTGVKYSSNIPGEYQTNQIDENLSDGRDKKIGIYDELGKYAKIDLLFTDSASQTKPIKEFMQDKPTIISMNYYNCPGICSTQFAELAALVDLLDLDLKDFQVLTISIEPTDTPKLALAKKDTFFQNLRLKPDLPDDQWKFLVGNKENIKMFSESIGYYYKKTVDKYKNIDYIHPGALTILGKDGKITRYIYGIDYSPFDVKLALIEASKGQVGGIRVQALAYCFAYDPQAKKYVFMWEKIVGGVMFFSVLALFIYLVITGRKKEE